MNGGERAGVLTARDLDGALHRSMRRYYRLINGFDYALGTILEELKTRGLAESTVIIFYSDNGHFMEEHGFGGKWLMYEESIRVPGFIFDPRSPKPAAATSELVLNIDIAPTILQLAGLEAPGHMQGKSLLPLMRNPDQPFREDFFYEHRFRAGADDKHIEASEGVRTRDWKYIRYIDHEGEEAEELYHLKDDPLEMRDLSGSPEAAAVLDRLRERYRQYFD